MLASYYAGRNLLS